MSRAPPQLMKKMLMIRLLLMATCSKKILVLGWAPPDEEDVDDKVVDKLCGGRGKA